MNPEALAFIRAICANPKDDVARLVYADWLDEHGNSERAAFIRVQVELAKFPATLSHYHWRGRTGCKRCRRDELQRREKKLFALDNSQGWNGFLIDGMSRHLIENRMEEDPVWRRGFIEELHTGTDDCDMLRVMQLVGNPSVVLRVLTCTAEGWLAHADQLVWNEGMTDEAPLSYEERRNYRCKVCENVPDEYGALEHGKGCYVESEDGGGTSWVDLPTKTVPRPCPEGAQPIERVKLTEVGAEHWHPLQLHNPQPGVCRSLKWPSIEFELS